MCVHQSAVTVVFHNIHCWFRLLGVSPITEWVTRFSRPTKSETLGAEHSTFAEVTLFLLQAVVEGCRVLETLAS